MTRNIGWRSRNASEATSAHYLDEAGHSICDLSPTIALSEAMIAAAPRAFPPNMVKRLRALPVCSNCKARDGWLTEGYPTAAAGIKYVIDTLRKRVAELEAQQ